MPRAITEGLRLRNADVLTAQEDGATRLADLDLLNRAAELGRILFTRDADLLAEATAKQRAGRMFAGLVYAHQLRVSVGQCVHDLDLIAVAADPSDLAGRVEYLPLR